MKNIAINSSGGGSEKGVKGKNIVESDITLKISKIIKNNLDKYNINTLLLRDKDITISYDERIKKLNNTFKDKKNTIVLSNTLMSGTGSGIEIIYPLNYNDKLPNILEKNLKKFNTVNVYQYRYSVDPKEDYYYITRKTKGYETIIIRYGVIPKDETLILNNYEKMAKAVSDSVVEYLGLKISKDVYHKVIKGDTLYSLAKKYNTTVAKLKEINNLKNNTIYLNQELKVK